MPHFIVSLSGSSLGDCQTVLEFMRASGIAGNVTRNKSINFSGEIESGCRMFALDSNVDKIRQLFDSLQSRHAELECAHVRAIHDEVEGCIYNICHTHRHNQCPGYIKKHS